MSTEHELKWTNHSKVSAAELMLLAGGPHLRKPTAESWMVIGTKPKTGDKRDWNSIALPVHQSTEFWGPFSMRTPTTRSNACTEPLA
jgi:hypothetical protein